ncbi:YjgB family protein [Paenibacillus nuruki]|uniref:YjgB family protein n=1 Tax=Paenibacillus nuruki TaxID=1886670 RepID=UPI002804C6AE|nr:YjgB family protein [Paenibacillus nuruki]CAJ1317482.1 DUF4309 domain-containing protein [Paenibacillus nuruki]
MNTQKSIKQVMLTATLTGVLAVGTLGLTSGFASVQTVSAATPSKVTASDSQMALKTLNSFYKPALKGQFPGNASAFTVGKTTRDQVVKAFGKPDKAMTDADGFDTYHAEMGNPGYAFNYKLTKIREMRYFGTTVERQTNIGGITMKMLLKNWYTPSATTTIKNGKMKQTKVTYVRGAYQLEFIFNSSTELDHINLREKGL